MLTETRALLSSSLHLQVVLRTASARARRRTGTLRDCSATFTPLSPCSTGSFSRVIRFSSMTAFTCRLGLQPARRAGRVPVPAPTRAIALPSATNGALKLLSCSFVWFWGRQFRTRHPARAFAVCQSECSAGMAECSTGMAECSEFRAKTP